MELAFPFEREPESLVRFGHVLIVTGHTAASGQRLLADYFCQFILAQVMIDAPDGIQRLHLDFRLIGEFVSHALTCTVQNLREHFRVLTLRHRRPHAVEHVPEKLGHLLALGDFCLGLPPRLLLLEKHPGGDAQANDERGEHRTGRHENQFVSSHQFLESVKVARRTGHHRFIVQMALNVRGQAVGRFVTAGAVFFQRLHHDPVQVAAHQMNQFGRLGLPVLGRLPSGPLASIVLKRVEGRGGSFSRIVRRISSRPACSKLLGVERRLAGQQFVKQHAQAVNVAARVNVQPAHLRLLRTHVGGRADELLEGGEERLVGQVWPCVALAMPKSITLGTGTPSCIGDQDVRRLDVAMDDALLVRVLDGLANLDEQIQPLPAWRDCSGRSNR